MATDSDAEARLFASRVLGQTRSPDKIGTLLGDASATDTSVVRRRWGTVTSINDVTRTVDVRLDGVILPSLPRVTWYRPMVGETVMVEISRTDAICTGPVGLSANNVFSVEGHTHSQSKNPPALHLYAPPVSQDLDGGYFIDLAGTSLDADEIRLDLSAPITLGGPGVASGRIPNDGQTVRLSFKAHSKNRAMTFRTERDNDWSLPGDGFINPVTVDKDTISIGIARYNLEQKRWLIEDIKRQHPVRTVKRPTQTQRWVNSGASNTVSLNTGSVNVGDLIVLAHCNDFGYWGEMQTPSGTVTPGDWTFIGGGGTDFKSHVNFWVARAKQSGVHTITVNQAYVFATVMFVYIFTGAGVPNASDYFWKTTPNPEAAPTTAYVPSAPYSDSIMVSAISLENACTISGIPSGWAGDSTTGIGASQQASASDANGTYSTCIGASKYVDAKTAAVNTIQITVSPSQTYTAGSLFIPGA